MSNWRPYDPSNEPTEAPEPEDRCVVCGNSRTPHRYRHIFQSAADARKRLESTQKRTCKLHRDCREADELVRAAGGREITCKHNHTDGSIHETCLGCRVLGPLIVMTAHHE